MVSVVVNAGIISNATPNKKGEFDVGKRQVILQPGFLKESNYENGIESEC